MHIYNWYHSNVAGIHYIHKYRLQYTWRIPLAFLSPLADSFLLPFLTPLYLLGNPPSCDMIHPPWSQVACKLTSSSSTLNPIPPPSKFPEPRLSSASLWRPQEPGIFCPEHCNRSDYKLYVIWGKNSSFLFCMKIGIYFNWSSGQGQEKITTFNVIFFFMVHGHLQSIYFVLFCVHFGRAFHGRGEKPCLLEFWGFFILKVHMHEIL